MKSKICLTIVGIALVCVVPVSTRALAKDVGGRAPAWEKATVLPASIDSRPLEGAPPRGDADQIAHQLSDEAAARVERLLLEHQLAKTVERVASPAAGSTPVAVGTTVTLPLSLPPGVIGLRASSRKGVFATATITVTGSSGEILAKESADLNWNDMRWMWGGRARHNYKRDDMLRKFVRKSVDRAMGKLAKHDFASVSR